MGAERILRTEVSPEVRADRERVAGLIDKQLDSALLRLAVTVQPGAKDAEKRLCKALAQLRSVVRSGGGVPELEQLARGA